MLNAKSRARIERRCEGMNVPWTVAELRVKRANVIEIFSIEIVPTIVTARPRTAKFTPILIIRKLFEGSFKYLYMAYIKHNTWGLYNYVWIIWLNII